MKSETTPHAERLAGIEWMRAFAAFGVICIHSGVAIHNQSTPAVGIVREGFDFVVPFFLMTAFFFAVRAEQERWVPWGAWLKRCAGRLLLPFAFWSVVYLALHVAKLLLHHQNDQIAGLFTDPAALVLGGGTSLALYFVPLLVAGLVLLHALSPLFKSAPLFLLGIGFLAAMGLHGICGHYGFDYDMTPNGPGPAPVRLLVGLLEEAVRCSPLIFAAAIMVRCLPRSGRRNVLPLLAAGALLVGVTHLSTTTGPWMEPALGVGSFLVGWAISGLVGSGPAAMVAGLFSFGVYLIHQVFLEVIQVLYTPAGPVGIFGVLAVTLAVYVASMLVVGLVSLVPSPVARKIVGLK